MAGRIGRAAAVVLVNLLVLAVLVVLCELALGNWLQVRTQPYCLDQVFHHAYCPGISNTTRLSPDDGGAAVENHIDLTRVRVPRADLVKQSTDVSAYQVINLGDSFIEADEIPYEQTLGRVAGALSGKSVLDFGYSSWAPIIYRNWIGRQKLREGVRVNIFVMVNDVTPEGGTTALGYRREAIGNEGGLFRFWAPDNDPSLRGILARNSYFYAKIPLLRHGLFLFKDFVKFSVLGRSRPEEAGTKQETAAAPASGGAKRDQENPWLDADFSRPQSDCALLERYRRQLPPKEANYLTFDYLSFAFRPGCWSAGQHAEIAATVEDIRWIEDYVRKVNGSVRVYIVPPGWSFPGENLIGKAAPYYRMREGTVITTLPLAEHLGSLLSGIPVVSLEPVIAKLKAEHPGQFYFPRDGHWTPLAHRHLGRWLASELAR